MGWRVGWDGWVMWTWVWVPWQQEQGGVGWGWWADVLVDPGAAAAAGPHIACPCWLASDSQLSSGCSRLPQPEPQRCHHCPPTSLPLLPPLRLPLLPPLPLPCYRLPACLPQALTTSKAVVVGQASIGGPFELVDQRGKPFTDKDLRGQFSLLYFGFCYCPDVCPEELEKVSQAVDLVGEGWGQRAWGGGGLKDQPRIRMACANPGLWWWGAPPGRSADCPPPPRPAFLDRGVCVLHPSPPPPSLPNLLAVPTLSAAPPGFLDRGVLHSPPHTHTSHPDPPALPTPSAAPLGGCREGGQGAGGARVPHRRPRAGRGQGGGGVCGRVPPPHGGAHRAHGQGGWRRAGSALCGGVGCGGAVASAGGGWGG